MAICDACQQEMTAATTTGCIAEPITFADGQELAPVPFASSQPGERCLDCRVADGGAHHPGCDRERCPKCGDQFTTCGCLGEVD